MTPAPQADVQSVGTAEMGQGGLSGAFAQLLLQLFGGDGLSANLNGDALPVSGKDGKQENTAAMQMMAELFAQNGIFLPDMSALSAEDAAAVMEALSTGGGAADVLNALVSQGLSADAALEIAQNIRQTASQNGQPVFSFQPASDVQEGSALDAASIVVEKEASSDYQLFDGQMQFRQSVAQAQKALQKSDREEKPEAAQQLDIEALQQKVDAERPNMTAALRGKGMEFQHRTSVVSQMRENVLKTLSEGRDEFTVKLKPESLGEITVKMTRDDEGKISMSIITASAQTAKLLNESAEALKNSLRPLQAEVREIVPRAEQNEAAQQGGLFGSGFESFQHSQQFTRQDQPQYFVEHPSYESETSEEQSEPAAEDPQRLNAYI